MQRIGEAEREAALDEEALRLKALYAYDVLDTEPEKEFDQLVFVAATVCQTPIALVSLVDHDRLFFKARHGVNVVSVPTNPYSRKSSGVFCHTCISGSGEVFLIHDAKAEPEYQQNPLVLGPPFVRFYAGAPLCSSSGHRLGNLCVLDTCPRTLNKEQKDSLMALSSQVVAQMELRIRNRVLLDTREELLRRNAELLMFNREKQRLLGMVSHDLRQPLCSIKVCGELLQQVCVNEKQCELVECINGSVVLMDRLVENLLMESAESIHAPIPGVSGFQAVNLVPLVRRNILANSHLAKKKSMNLVFKMDETIEQMLALADKTQIDQLLNNLVSNAIKYSHKNTTITVSLRRVVSSSTPLVDNTTKIQASLLHPSWCAQISVRDEGQGIPANQLPLLFTDKVNEVSVEPTGTETSTKLGLGIVNQIVKDHRGTIHAKSRVGVGTTFVVTLPLMDTVHVDSVATANPAPTQGALSRKRKMGSLQVLIAEDNAMNRKTLHILFSRLSHTTILCSDGKEALQRYLDAPLSFDAILLDMHMPIMGGREVCLAIREDEQKHRRPRVPIVMISGDSMSQEEMSRLGIDQLISKPFSSKVVETVEEVCSICKNSFIQTTKEEEERDVLGVNGTAAPEGASVEYRRLLA